MAAFHNVELLADRRVTLQFFLPTAHQRPDRANNRIARAELIAMRQQNPSVVHPIQRIGAVGNVKRDPFIARKKHDAEQAELVRLRAEAAAREQADREARIAAAAAESARLAAESAAQAEAERKERERAIEAERQAGIIAAQKIAEEQAILAAQEAEERAKQAIVML